MSMLHFNTVAWKSHTFVHFKVVFATIYNDIWQKDSQLSRICQSKGYLGRNLFLKGCPISEGEISTTPPCDSVQGAKKGQRLG